VGKTVLLQRYSIEAREAGWLVADREFSEADAEPSMFAQRVLADLTRLTRDLSLSRRLKDAAGGAVDRVTDLLGNLTVSYEGLELGYSPGRRSSKTPKQMLDDDLRDALREVGRLCQKSDHTGFILQYDEFQVVKEERRELTLSALLAATAAVQQFSGPGHTAGHAGYPHLRARPIQHGGSPGKPLLCRRDIATRYTASRSRSSVNRWLNA